MMEQDRADIPPDHVGIVVGQPDLLAQRRLRLGAQGRKRRNIGVRLVGKTRDREQERSTGNRIRVQRQTLELGFKAFCRPVAAGAVTGSLLIEFRLQHREVLCRVIGNRMVDDRLDAGRQAVLHTVRHIGAKTRRRQDW